MMEISVLRRAGPEETAHWQRFRYEMAGDGDTVATALTRLNEQPDLRDAEGNPALPIRWEHSCLQKKCGACAMVICGRPRLACDARLSEYRGTVRLEPLRKFPVVADLVVDRGVMFENLQRLSLWLEETAEVRQNNLDLAYEASRCLQCGCCLEVCPNFYGGGAFPGAAGAVPMGRVLTENPNDRDAAKRYRHMVFEGCGKSLACHDICPAGIDVERLMSRSGAAALWRRLRLHAKE